MIQTQTNKSHSFKRSQASPFAEIIQSSLQSFTAQSWNWDYFPAFGSLVTVITEKRTLFGIVYAVQTGSSDAGRYPFTFQKTEAELQAEQPQIFEFLQTTFSCLIVGFLEEGSIIYQMAPEPAKMHAFVNHATPAERLHFFSSHLYLHLIFNAPEITVVDELILSFLKTKKDLGLLTEESLLTFIETISLTNGDDYRKLKILINRAHPFLASL